MTHNIFLTIGAVLAFSFIGEGVAAERPLQKSQLSIMDTPGGTESGQGPLPPTTYCGSGKIGFACFSKFSTNCASGGGELTPVFVRGGLKLICKHPGT